MSNFDVCEVATNHGPMTRVDWHRGGRSQYVPMRLFTKLQLLTTEGVDLDRVIVGNTWQALIYARVQSPPLVMRITGAGVGMKELEDGMRLRAFLARLAMEGETKSLVDELLHDIWFEKDFASNTNAEIVDGG